jgi:prepilin-type N-terminal cleavage/methylation domain-containing protein
MDSGKRKTAFSLIELSIVLVILGLLTGGILAGQSLIRAAEIRSVATQMSNYRSALYSFRDKYFGWPGDFTNATRFWVSAGGTGSDNACISLQTTVQATCNGNGDGEIMYLTGNDHAERFLVWKHLANAGLVEGSYTGKSAGGTGTYVQVVGETNPRARISNGFFDVSFEKTTTGIHFPGSTLFRNSVNIYGNNATNGILLPEEAWNIDTKLDDGSPVYGAVFTTIKSAAWGTNCASSDINTATYDLTVKSPNCILRFAN